MCNVDEVHQVLAIHAREPDDPVAETEVRDHGLRGANVPTILDGDQAGRDVRVLSDELSKTQEEMVRVLSMGIFACPLVAAVIQQDELVLAPDAVKHGPPMDVCPIPTVAIRLWK